MDRQSRFEATRIEQLSIAVLLVGFLVLVTLNSWVSDDAYITFRTVDNFVNGLGLTWNVGERVQTYTHPLWMVLIAGSYAVTGEVFYTSQLVSICLSFLAVLLIVLRVARTSLTAMLSVVVLSLSKAFIDYSTSGLENPLTHVILAGFVIVYIQDRRSPRWFLQLSALAALGMLNRLDTGLLTLPALGWAFRDARSGGSLVAGLMGFLPLLFWELFSLFYYGAAVPNTALAKLNAGLIRASAIQHEGLLYLENSLRVDPITLVIICAAVLLPLLMREWRRLPLAAGIVLYVLYVVRVGGDFMSGRFLTAPLFQAVAIVALTTWHRCKAHAWLPYAVCSVALVSVALGSPYTPARAWGGKSADDDPELWVRGRSITDERAIYYHNTGLLEALRRRAELPDHDWAQDGRKAREAGPDVVVKGSVGFYGYYAGPSVHIVDLLALGDPLLSRLPVTDPNWQIGHFGRRPPQGYLVTLQTGENQIADPDLAAYYDKLSYTVQGDLWDSARWREVWRLNTGAYDHLLDSYAYFRGNVFAHDLEITNPAEHPYVYVYVWNNGAGETYLLDSHSARGRIYDVHWQVSAESVVFEGAFEGQVAQIGALSDSELLNIGVLFAPDASLGEYEAYERRYWFSLDQNDDEMTVVLPGLEWYNDEAPGGFWREMDVDQVIGPGS